jgi:hypothetical protein
VKETIASGTINAIDYNKTISKQPNNKSKFKLKQAGECEIRSEVERGENTRARKTTKKYTQLISATGPVTLSVQSFHLIHAI